MRNAEKCKGYVGMAPNPIRQDIRQRQKVANANRWTD